jgi:hypothetical protein
MKEQFYEEPTSHEREPVNEVAEIFIDPNPMEHDEDSGLVYLATDGTFHEVYKVRGNRTWANPPDHYISVLASPRILAGREKQIFVAVSKVEKEQ